MQKRYCLAFDLRNDPALIRQYRYVHSKEGMWPDIPKGIKAVGILDMEIYLHGTRMFMILETPAGWDYDSEMARCGTLEKQAEWGEYVWQFQQRLPYAEHGEKWMHMENIFRLSPSGLKETATSGYSEPVYLPPTKRFVSILDLENNPRLNSHYSWSGSPEGLSAKVKEEIKNTGILDVQIYHIGTRLCLIVERAPDFQWNNPLRQSLPGTWILMENVFDLNRDF